MPVAEKASISNEGGPNSMAIGPQTFVPQKTRVLFQMTSYEFETAARR